MTLLALLLVAQAIPAAAREQRVGQAAVLEAFRAFCLTPAVEAGALADPAAAAGFRPTAVMPTGFEWVELAAWERGGIRLFRMTDPREESPRAMCGVSASVARPDTDHGLVDAVAAIAHTNFGEGHSGRGISNTTLGRRGGAVRIDIDRSSAPDVRVRLVAWPMR